ncbi:MULTISPECIES: hypothetical protein [unclassified Pseudomonas]|uniref:hypothetical protein n=1 Tax=unclassified Pseudomonas TaxID=196821 RepID=UPI000BC6B1C8|nr:MULTISPECIES: hypothetical protein [unclassified Pseudomonas]PVZ19963.1 hypothetical protein F474_00554 [Pseudomonas sp. URIL14HWK12:I12]PVZ27029.1 hypothetical protein F470_00209 [Pseudomonas sp. URIL14HWK12:I10]PVZ37918.1 hypothetical protein F472_00554 [Pseudomonas sp. URIL14HWK12:I11]SNZ05146.1 hypothetical protein SAMN05660463_00850 [Pseudomonas sp. URIL14HWK12:I9]
MISNELSTIREKDADRAWLAKLEQDFHARGRRIEVVDRAPSTTAFCPYTATKAQTKARAVKAMQVQADELALAARVRELAKTMAVRAVCLEMGLTRTTVRGIAERHRISFKSGKEDARKANQQRYASIQEDARDAARLRAYSDLGASFNHAANHSGIGRTRAERLAREFAIPFKKRGKTA